MCRMRLEHLVIPDGGEVLENDEGPTKRCKSQSGEAPAGHMGRKDDNCNVLKHVKSVSIRKFVVTFKKKANETPKPHINTLVPFEGCQKNQFITSRLVNTGKESNTFSVFPIYTVPQADHLGDEGKFLFTEVFELINERE